MRLNKDNETNAFCIFALVTIMCVIIILVLKLFFGQKIEIGFIKDIFSIGSTLAAALIAIALYSDWKEEHNKIIESNSASELINIILQTKVQLRLVKILLNNSETNNYLVNIEISKIIDNFEKNNQIFQENMEFFNLLIQKEIKNYENFLGGLESLVDSFGNIVKLAVITEKSFIENHSKFIPLINKYIQDCDDFCNYLVKFVKAK
ncbi:hypothetical protein [Acinetobacter pittii]|uniref:hypothetical protein n=1 Tax=Acinetobacter pittii TaxID=48296 RepID=UPI003016717E